jgi:hypothetical protein
MHITLKSERPMLGGPLARVIHLSRQLFGWVEISGIQD